MKNLPKFFFKNIFYIVIFPWFIKPNKLFIMNIFEKNCLSKEIIIFDKYEELFAAHASLSLIRFWE